MQFCQPAFSGYAPNYTPCNPPPPFQYNGYPEIVGDGHVTSVILPDGSIQYLFLPTNSWWRPPQPCAPNYGTNNTQWNNNGAWFIRSAYTPMPPSSYPTMCNPSYQPSYQGLCGFQTPVASNSCIELHKANYQMKFHNDGCTSTSDIHYFYPSLRNWFQIRRECASCQTETSTTNSSSQDQEPIDVNCSRLCKCPNGNKTKMKDDCMCCSSDSDTTSSKMSIEKSSEIKTKNSSKKKKSKESDNTRPSSSKGYKKKEKLECMCYSSDSNKSTSQMSIGKPNEIKTKKSSEKKKSKERDDTPENIPKAHKTKEKPVEVICNRPCKCTNGNKAKGKDERMCSSSDSNTSTGKMSIEKSTKKSNENKQTKEQNADKKPQTKSDESSRNKKVQSKTSKKVICKCNDPPQRENKSITTYNEQGSNCGEQFGRETQTKSNIDAGSITNINPKEKAKKPGEKTSYTGDYESCCDTTCSCYTTSETESDRPRPNYSKKKKTK